MGFGGGARVVDVVFDVEVVADGQFLIGDDLEHTAGGLREIGIRPGENEAGVSAAREFRVTQTRGKVPGFGGKRKASAVDQWTHPIETGVTGDLVVLLDGWDELVQLLPGLRSGVLERAAFFDEHVMDYI